MATVSDYIQSSLSLIGILAEGETPSAEQGAQAMPVLNDMMFALADDGIDLGFFPQSSTTDTLLLPEGSRETIKCLFAIRLRPYYPSSKLPPEVIEFARQGYNRLLTKAVLADGVERRSTLPRGEGQRCRVNILTGV